MNNIMEYFLNAIHTPYLLNFLGLVTAISVFISPILYNGDYKIATKGIVITFGYAFFVALITWSRIASLNSPNGNRMLSGLVWLMTFVFLAYVLGLFIGVFVHRKINR